MLNKRDTDWLKYLFIINGNNWFKYANRSMMCFVLFEFNIPLENISHIWRRRHYWWWAVNKTYARHLRSLSSLGCPFIMIIHDTHTFCRAFSSWAVTTCCYGLGLSRLGFEHTTFSLRGQCSNPLRHRSGLH